MQRISLSADVILKLTITTLLFINSSSQNCGPGTLKCNVTINPPRPSICDSQRDYILNQASETCQKSVVAGCELGAINLETSPCLLCEPGKRLDQNEGQCLDVGEPLKKENCFRYSRDGQQCTNCKEGFWLNNGSCSAVTSSIDNCLEYADLEKCKKCIDSYRLIENKCQRFQTLPNCQVHTNRMCRACKTGTFYSLDFAGASAPTTDLLTQIAHRVLSEGSWSEVNNVISSCPVGDVANCKKFTSKYLCLECSNGYFLNEKKQCELNPEATLANCKMYANHENCKECEGTFFLQGDPQICVKATSVAHCSKYQNFKDVCWECLSTHWLNDTTRLCQLRNYPKIKNCVSLNRLSDTCVSCDSNMILTGDQQKCLPSIPNCSNLMISLESSSLSHTCLLCLETHYLKDNSCLVRDREHCSEYEHNQNKCIKCLSDKYYIHTSTSSCQLRDNPNCKTYLDDSNDCQLCDKWYYLKNAKCVGVDVQSCDLFKENRNQCQVCRYGSYFDGEKCAPNSAVNCEFLDRSKRACSLCQAHYYSLGIFNGKNCLPQSLSNCIAFEDQKNVCTKCAKNHILNNGGCVMNDADNCIEYTAESDSCVKCSVGYYPTGKTCTAQNRTGCIEFAAHSNNCSKCGLGYFLNNLACEVQQVAHCIEYAADSGNCAKCASGYYPKTAKICEKQIIENCIKYNTDTKECTKCAANYTLISASSCKELSTSNCIEYTSSTGLCSKCAVGFWLSSSDKSCQTEGVTGCIEYHPNTGNCKTCAKARWLKSSSNLCPELSTANCAQFDMSNGKCSKCFDMYTLSGDQSTCTLNKITDCVEYNTNGTCKTCMLQKYLKENECVSVDKSNCIEYAPNTNNCTRCSWAYYTNSNSCVEKSVSHCIEYTDNSPNCTLCAVGHYLKSASECAEINQKGNCISYNLTTGVCSECDKHFYLSGVTCLLREGPFCIEYQGNTSQCTRCQIGYYLDSSNLCKIQESNNCLDFADNANTCSKCRAGYWLSGSTCTQQLVANCLEYETNSADCKTCAFGFYKESASSCKKQELTGCIKHEAQKNDCLKCGMKYYFSSKKCLLRTLTGCVLYNDNLNTCQTCASGYYRSSDGSQCHQLNKANCLEYTNETCSKCVQGWWWDSSGGGSCKKQSIANCAQYKENLNECNTCARGSGRINATTCSPGTTNNCILYNEALNKCSECAYGTFIQTDFSCSPQTTIVGCVQYRPNLNKCEQCRYGKYPNGDLTQCLDQQKPNCLKYEFNKNFCLVCAKNYYANSSGSCAAQDVANCQDYTLGSGTCLKCKKGYYLHSDHSTNITCKPQDMEHCVVFTNNANICEGCDPLHYFEENECKPRDVTNCLSYNTNLSTCDKCVQLFKKAASGGNCEANSHITNCKIHSTDEPAKCSTCVNGYYSLNGVCTVQNSIPECIVYENNQPLCKTCSTKFLINTAKTVCGPNNNVSNCEEYLVSDKTNCTKCESLYYLQTSTSCTKITLDNNCFQSNGDNNNSCTKCKAGFYRSSPGVGLCQSAKIPANIDPQCQYVTESADNKKCSGCNSNYFLGQGTSQSKTVAQMQTGNCVKVNGTTGVCSQCKEFHQLGSNGSCTLITADKKTLPCKQKVESDTSALTTAANCAKCTFDSVYYLSGSTCTSRASKTNLKNCGKFSSNSSGCLGCKENTYKFQQTFTESCVVNSSINGDSTLIASCAFYEKVTSPAQCKICNQDYELESPTKCIQILNNRKILRAYDEFMDPAASFSNPGPITNCVLYIQTDKNTIGCGKCSTNYVGIVSFNSSNNTTALDEAYSNDNNMSVKEVLNTFTECISSTKIIFIDTAPATPEKTCAIGYKVETGYGCLRCLSGKIGKFGTANKVNNGTYSSPILANLGSSAFTISGCVDETSMKRINHMMYHMYFDKPWALRFHNHLNFDSCVTSGTSTVDATKTLLFLYLLDLTNGHLARTVRRDNTDGGNIVDLKQAYCLDNAKITTTVQHCQFYILETDLSADINPSTASFGNATCGSCKPGYKPNTFSGKITSCTLISDCDISNASTNTWLNSCQTPSNGAWRFNSALTPAMIEYHTPVTSAQKVENCLVVNIDNSNHCVMCSEGYEATGGMCAPALGIGSSCLYRMGRADFTPEGGDIALQRRQFANLLRLRWEIIPVNYISMVSAYCGSCSSTPSSSSPFLEEGVNFTVCKHQSPAPGGAAGNCEIHDFTDSSVCLKCLSGYALKPNGVCAQATGARLTDCLESSNDEQTCTKCISTKYWNSTSNSCVLHYCLEYSTSTPTNCLLCQQGKGLDGTNTTHCSSTANSETDCDYTSPDLGHCVKGKNGKVPYAIFSVYSGENSGNETLKRVEYKTFSLSGVTYDFYNLDYTFIKIVYTPSESSASVAANLMYVSTASQATRVYTNSLTPTNLADNHCFSSIPDANCTTSLGPVCSKCKAGYFPNRNGTCQSNTNNSDCLESYSDGSNNDTKCVQCPTSKYLQTPNTCTNRSISSTCPGKSPTADQCTQCGGIQYPNGSGACINNTATNCNQYSNLKLECKTCEMGLYLNSSDPKVCTAYSAAENCKEYKTDADQCVSCEHGYRANGTTCVRVTKRRCLTYVNTFTTTDACATCLPEYRVVGGECVAKTAKRCLTYHTSEDKCATCMDQYTLGAKDCEPKTPRLCKTFKVGNNAPSDMCLSCDDDYVKTNSGGTDSCVLKTVSLCKSFATGTDNKCASCTSSYTFDSGAGTCTIKPTTTCKEPSKGTAASDSDKCLKCSDDYLLTGSKCVKKTAELCLSYSATEDKCKTCSILHLLGAKNCEAKTATGCQEMNEFMDSCKTCGNFYYPNGNNCSANTGTTCKGFKTDANGCVECWPTFKPSALNCDSNTGTMCLTYKSDSHGCNTCSEANMLDGSSNCIKKTASSCKEIDPSTNNCKSCFPGHVLSGNFPNSCTPNIGKHCVTYKDGAHGCAVCSKLYKLDGDGNCALKEALNCKEIQSTNVDSCLVCPQSRFLNSSTGNCDKSSAKACLQYSTTKNECTTCPSYFLLNQQKSCVLNPGQNCKVIGASSLGCNKCALGFSIDPNTNNCVKSTKTNCKTYTPDVSKGALNECKTCGEHSFRKHTDNNCVAKTGKNCKTYAPGNGENCGSCYHGFYLNGNNCDPISATKCLLMSTNGNSCASCSELFYTNGNNCETNTKDNCLSLKTDSAGCNSCSAGFKSNTSTKNCDKITGTNCLSLLTDSNGCSTCSTGLFFKNGSQCSPKSGTNCDSYNSSSTGCATCLAGFYKHSNSNCVAIDRTNCDGFKTTANECQTCKTGFIKNSGTGNCDKNSSKLCLTYSSSALTCGSCSNGYIFTTPHCVKSTAKNCKTTQASVDQCNECDALFYKDSDDGKCKRNTASYCLEFDSNNNECTKCELGWYVDNKTCKRVDKPFCLTFEPDLNQCKTCVRGYVFNSVSKVCDANQAQSCYKHKMAVHKCEECLNDYFLDSNELCAQNTSLHCETKDKTANKCYKCKATYWRNPSNGLCLENLSENCKEKSRVANRCEECVQGMFMSTNSNFLCLKSTAENCLVNHLNKDQCVECQPNTIAKMTGGKLTCEKYTATGCSTFNQAENECLSCLKDFFKVKTQLSNRTKIDCQKRKKINCVHSNFEKDECLSCQNEYYLDSEKNCKSSTTISFCAQYSGTTDQCVQCATGYYKVPAKNECRRFPDGIPHCLKYQSRAQCSQCDSETYLDVSVCKNIVSGVDKCVRYLTATLCHSCETGYLVVNNTCVQITAKNCAQIETPTTCLTCSDNFVFQNDGKCVSSNITNCKKPKRGETGIICTKCAQGFSLSKDFLKCEPATKPIANCLDYSDTDKCSLCAENHLLSGDKKACEPLGDRAGTGCLQGHVSDSIICDQCDFGYQRNPNGQCLPIKASDCYVYDPIWKVCTLCASGYYMDKSSNCIEYAEEIKPVILPGDTSRIPGYLTIFSNHIFKLMVLLIWAMASRIE